MKRQRESCPRRMLTCDPLLFPVTTTEVAAAMLKLAEDPELGAGTVLEVGHENTRSIPLMGNTGPEGAGHTLTNAAVSVEELYG